MSRVDKPQDHDAEPGRAAGRRVSPTKDRFVLPEQSRDDTDQGWGERPYSNDERLLAERPPHWD